MPSLQTIPRELRDEILSYVLLARRPAPQTSNDVERQVRERLPIRNSWTIQQVYYPSEPAAYIPNALPLLLCCKQIYEETKENLGRLFAGGPNYEADVKFVNDRYLAPTWVLLPALSEKVNHICVRFQSTGFVQHPVPERSHMNIWRGGDGGPPSYVWMFYSLLERFLSAGPRGKEPPDPKYQPYMTIHCLELDFVDPEPSILAAHEPISVGMKCRSAWRHRPRPAAQTDKPPLVATESLARLFCSEIQALLYMGYHTASYGAVLHERIGAIVIKINGETIEELDLGQMLADVRFNDSFGTTVVWDERLEYWIAWKKAALQARRERDLKVVEPDPNWIGEASRDAARIYAGRVI